MQQEDNHSFEFVSHNMKNNMNNNSEKLQRTPRVSGKFY